MATKSSGTGAVVVTDVSDLWKAAIEEFEKTTKTKFDSIPRVNNVDDILKEVKARASSFQKVRHDEYELDKFRSLLARSLTPVEQLSKVVSSAVVLTANNVSADYDTIAGFFEDLDLYLKRLKIPENRVPSIPELVEAITGVLTSVLVLCGICAKQIKTRLYVKPFKTLVSSKDNELSTAYERFRKTIEQEQRAVTNATLVAAGNLQKQTNTIHNVGRECLSTTKQIKSDFSGTFQSQRDQWIGNQFQAGGDIHIHSVDEDDIIQIKDFRTVIESREAILEREDIEKRLSMLNFHQKQKDVFAKHEEGTGQWLLETDEFKQWMDDTKPAVFWGPGTRKTVMTALAIDHVQESVQGKGAAIAYLYCDYKDPTTHSELGLLSSIARQLTELARPLPKVVKEFCEKQAERRRNPAEDEWISLISTICPLFSTTFVFIDALDECPEINRERFLRSLERLSPFLKIFITSQPSLSIEGRFANTSRVEISATDLDIRTFLEHQITKNNRLARFTAKEVGLKEDIIDGICDKARGMFLLAQFQLDRVCCQSSLKAIRNAMETLPREIFDYYRQAFNRIESHKEENRYLAKQALSFIFCARRPLTLPELGHVLSVEAGDTALDGSALPDTDIVLDVTMGLIRVNEKSGTIGLVHGTLHKYLEEHPDCLLPDFEVKFAKACLTYLLFDTFREGPCKDGAGLEKRLHIYEFLDYVCHNWGYHVLGNQLHPDVLDALFVFLKDKEKLSASVQILYVSPVRAEDWHDRFPKYFSALHTAAYWGLHDIILLLLKDNTNVNITDSDGMTALHLAAKNGHESIVQLLISKGASIDTKNSKGETALLWSVRNCHENIAKLLLANGANSTIKDNEEWAALDWVVLSGHENLVRLLLSRSTNLDIEHNGGRRALYLAAEEGHEHITHLLLDGGVDVNIKDSYGSSALDWAAPSGRQDVVRVLLQNGADINSRDNYGNTVLHWAIPHKELVSLLLDKGADIDAENDAGQTALCWVAQDGSVEVAETLLRNNADTNVQDVHGFTPLHRAALRGRDDMVRLLLQHGALPQIASGNFWTPLHVAALKGYDEVVMLLLDHIKDGKDVLCWMIRQKQDPRKVAYFNTCVEQKAEASTVLTGLRATVQEHQIARSKVLLEKGADVNARDVGGWTALIMAVWGEERDATHLLLEYGADVNVCGFDRRTALHWASEYGDEAASRLLVANGAIVNASAYGWTPSLLAAKNGHMDVVEFLLANGADPKEEDYHGRSALHWAAKHGSETTIETLMDKGADINATDRWGRTALMWAVEHLEEAATRTLLWLGADADVKARHGITALHVAVFVGSSSIVQHLRDQAVDVEAEALWSCPTGSSEPDFEKLDIMDTKHQALSTLLLQQYNDGESGVDDGSKRRCSLTAQQLAVKTGNMAAERLLTTQKIPVPADPATQSVPA
ncbi:hypothetical protein LTR70_010039 [Exophiala xenobiotica]|nr:hypothetical protein LTR70_010039 [Exophiala xenobiotica]